MKKYGKGNKTCKHQKNIVPLQSILLENIFCKVFKMLLPLLVREDEERFFVFFVFFVFLLFILYSLFLPTLALESSAFL